MQKAKKEKTDLGRKAENWISKIIKSKSKFKVNNMNNLRSNFPIVDLIVHNRNTFYHISVKAKQGKNWPAVKGIHFPNQYLAFVDYKSKNQPDVYILNHRQWNGTLKKILPSRGKTASIAKGAIEWNWDENGVKKYRRGSLLSEKDIFRYKNNWSVLPGIVK